MKAKDGGQAFPTPAALPYNERVEGMSMRDYFAAAALHGIVVSGAKFNPLGDSALAYRYADIMLAERDKEAI